MPETTAADFAQRLTAVRQRIRRACARAGRPADDVALVAVSKRQNLARVRAALAAGVQVLGESQVQEALEKSAALRSASVEWQLIGHLQSNKAKAAVGLFRVIHSLDRPKIIARVEDEAARQGKRIDGFLEVNLGEEASKHGFSPAAVAATIAPLVADLEHLHIVGLMAIPPFDDDPEASRPWFRRLRELRDELAELPQLRRGGDFGALSMGMSGDFEVAIEEGATHVRVGTALFGERLR